MTAFPTKGYEIIEGPFDALEMRGVARAYDNLLAAQSPAAVRRGSTSTRFGGLAALPLFARLYTYQPLLDLARSLAGPSLKLSALHARTLRPNVPAGPLHQDVRPGGDGDPLVAFILMVDDFTVGNGATRFLPGSQGKSTMPTGVDEQRATARAGSIVVFDGTIWHEHGANETSRPRRSVQGGFVRRDHGAAVNWSSEFSREQLEALPADAQALMDLPVLA